MARAVVVAAMAVETAMVAEAAVVMAVAPVEAALVALAVVAVHVGRAVLAVVLLVVNFDPLQLSSTPNQGALAAPFSWKPVFF